MTHSALTQSSLRWRMYRALCAFFWKQNTQWPALQGVSSSGARVWFHGASVGELEALWPVIEAWLRESPENRAVVSYWSDSAVAFAEREWTKCRAQPWGSQIDWVGRSPREGQWREALETACVRVFVTVRYEAWPDLWASASVLGVPMVLLGASETRSSWIWGHRILKCLGVRAPDFYIGEYVSQKNFAYPQALAAPRTAGQKDSIKQCMFTGDPRWERAHARLQQGSLQARTWIEKSKNLPRPWGILGSVWPEDLERLEPLLGEIRGTVWVVPHKPDQISEEVESDWQMLHPHLRIVWVREMGVLSELYGVMDWAYVGGGFGQGVHSTIEPAFTGIPLACGPRKSEDFPEVQELLQAGQLQILSREAWSEAQESQFVAHLMSGKNLAWSTGWKHHLGASSRVVELLKGSLSR